MKSGATCLLKIELNADISLVDDIIFTLKGNKTIQKTYPLEVLFKDDSFYIPLTQQDTAELSSWHNCKVEVEAQIDYKNKSVAKSKIFSFDISSTLATKFIEGNTPNNPDNSDIGLSIDGTFVAENDGSLINKAEVIQLINNRMPKAISDWLDAHTGVITDENVDTVVSEKVKASESVIRKSVEELNNNFDERAQTVFDDYSKTKKVVFEAGFKELFDTQMQADETRVKKDEFEDMANEFVSNSQIVVRTSTLKALLNHQPTVEALDEYFEARRSDKVYITKLPKFEINQTSTGIKEGANAGLVHEASTDTVEGRDDYAELPEFEWFHANYVRNDSGHAIVTATEFDEEYAETGAVDVGSVGMSFYFKWDTESDDEYIIVSYSTSPHPELGLIPFSGNVEGHSYWCLSAYASSKASDGLLRSQPKAIIENFQSYQNMITSYQKKGKGYWGCGIERNTLQLIMLAIKDATKNSQSVYAGLTSNNWQYSPAVKRDTLETYYPVTAAQAININVGDVVICGYGDLTNGAITYDRNYANMRRYADKVRVLKKEVLEDGNVAIYLDVQDGFPTADVVLNDTITAECKISSMAAETGETGKVIGRHDGSYLSNTNGKHPYRIQGIEYGVGYYIIPTDAVMVFKSDYSKDVYVAPKGITRTTTESTIKSKYKKIGNIPANTNGADFWIGDVAVDEETGGWYPQVKGSGDKVGVGDMCYAGGTATSGTREYLQGGSLWLGSNAGASCLYCGYALSRAWWLYCGCD